MWRIVSTVYLLLTATAMANDPIYCAGIDSLDQGVLTHIPSSDTINGIAIFALFPEDTVTIGCDTLYAELRNFGDTSGFGPGQIMLRSSFRDHIWVIIGFMGSMACLPWIR